MATDSVVKLNAKFRLEMERNISSVYFCEIVLAFLKKVLLF